MDIIFDCPNCSQELAVDSTGAGTDIECPSCGETISIPADPPETAGFQGAGAAEPDGQSRSPSSAAAKVEKHLKVPVRSTPAEPLIAKAKPPLGAQGGGRQTGSHPDHSPGQLH